MDWSRRAPGLLDAIVRRTGLQWRERVDPWYYDHFIGLVRNTPVAVVYRTWTSTTGSGTSKRTTRHYGTRFLALFSLRLPRGLSIAAEYRGFLSSLFGGGDDDIQTGYAAVDDLLKLEAQNASAVRRIFQDERSGRPIYDLINQNRRAKVAEHYVRIDESGWLDDVAQIEGLLHQTVTTVESLERALWWSPQSPPNPAAEAAPSAPAATAPTAPPSADATDADSPLPEPTPAHAAGIATLIDELRGEATGHDAGQFTIDRAVAKEKMRRFQLSDPEDFVLHLVQAAFHKGASSVRIELDRNDTTVRWQSAPFDVVDFDLLYGALLSSSRQPALRARQELAIGLGAAMALDPKHIRVRSGTAALELRPGRDDEFGTEEDEAEVDPTQTEIRVKGRLGDVFTRRASRLRRRLAVRCRYADREVWLDDERIDGGLHVPEAIGTTPIQSGSARGVVGFSPRLALAEIHWVSAGVWIATDRAPQLSPGLLAIVDATGLRTDLSGQQLVRDATHDAWVEAVRAAEWTAFGALGAELADGRVSADRFHWARGILTQAALRLSGPDDFRPGGRGEPIARAPLLPTITGEYLSLADVLAELDEGRPVRHADYLLSRLLVDPPFPGWARCVAFVDWLSDPPTQQLLGLLAGGGPVSANLDLQRLPRAGHAIDAGLVHASQG